MKRIVIISDTQIPFEDKRALKNVINFIGEYQPDEVIQIGDLVDYPAPSRWSAGTRAEYEGNVIRDSEYAKRVFLAPLREAYQGPIKVLEGNHDERPRKYLASRAPALAADDTFYRFESLLDFQAYEVEKAEPYYGFAPGWVAIHGHESPGLSQVPGATARQKAIKAGVSVVMGHTHRLAISPHTTGHNGKLKTIYGFEVGHLMDVRQAGYLKNGPANWQKGFGLFYVGKYSATPHAIPVADDGSFVVEGKRFGEIKRVGGKFAKGESKSG
ncbi:metallophosphoesterase family protein [Kitasatospora sp. NPDC004723]|uniref:metallophosphoesterase family protein n=1 Tax=Kitasatospora sp. NPDC004723 TaxID=3154288 RepID=UPI00339F8346